MVFTLNGNLDVNVNFKADPSLLAAVHALTSPQQPVAESKSSNFTFSLPKSEEQETPSTEAETEAETKTTKTETKSEPETETVEEPTETQETPTITFEEVKSKLTSLAGAGKQAEVKELIAQFGVKKLTDIEPEKYSELLAAAEEL